VISTSAEVVRATANHSACGKRRKAKTRITRKMLRVEERRATVFLAEGETHSALRLRRDRRDREALEARSLPFEEEATGRAS